MELKEKAKEFEEKSKEALLEKNPLKAMQYVVKAGEIYEDLAMYQDAGLAFFSGGSLASITQQESLAVDLFKKAFLNFEKIKNYEWIEKSLERIIQGLNSLEDYEEAFKYANFYYELEKLLQHPLQYFTSVFYLFLAFTNLGKEKEAKSLLKESLQNEILKKDIKLEQNIIFLSKNISNQFKFINDKRFEEKIIKAKNFHLLGYLYYERAVLVVSKSHKKAFHYLRKARKLAIKSSDIMLYFHTSISLLILYHLRGQRFKVVETLMITAATLSNLLGEQIKPIFFNFLQTFSHLWGEEEYKKVYNEFLKEYGILKE